MDQGKVDKKAAKAEAKAIKKMAKAESDVAAAKQVATPTPVPNAAAERSAQAAEKQLTIRRWQLWVSIVGVSAALITAAVALLR